jgi:hypothetical protein
LLTWALEMSSYVVLQNYPHLEFRRCWDPSQKTLMNLGRCEAYIQCLGDLPIDPAAQGELRRRSFARGAQATTAIEGNTLTDEDLAKVLAGQQLPESRAFQEREVTNVLGLMNGLWKEVVGMGKCSILTVAVSFHEFPGTTNRTRIAAVGAPAVGIPHRSARKHHPRGRPRGPAWQ